MKTKSIIAALAVLAATAASAATARMNVVSESPNRETGKPYTPVSLNIVTPIGLPWGFNWDVKGFQVGIYNQVQDFSGLQIGFFNVTGYCEGLQIGGVNVTEKMYGVQIGFFNVINDNDVPFLPLINWYF